MEIDEVTADSKFSHLLKPIRYLQPNYFTQKPLNSVQRDLAANWDIDIASELDDYLKDLEQIIIGEGEDDHHHLNFAQGKFNIKDRCVE